MEIVLKSIMKYLRGIRRNRSRLAILLLAPVIFFSFFGFIFTTGGGGQISRTIGIVNHDQSYPSDLNVIVPEEIDLGRPVHRLSSQFLDIWENHTSKLIDSDIKIDLVFYDSQKEMVDDVESQNIHLGLVIPEKFTVAILEGINQLTNQSTFPVNQSLPVLVTTFGDPTIEVYQSAMSLFTQALDSFTTKFVGTEALYTKAPAGGHLSFHTQSVQANEFSQVDFFFPGFLVFLVILQAINISVTLAYEKENQTITRMKLSKMYSWELFAGITIGQVIAFSAQFLISAIVLSLWGVNLNILGWLRIFVIAQMTNIVIIGLSLIVASFVSTVDNAGTVTGIGSAPLGFLSGSFIQVPEVYLLKSLKIQFWDLIPTYQATYAVQRIMFHHADLGDVIGRILALAVFALIFFGIGILAFNRNVVHGDT